eukprot:2988899-Pleurochrysis_carterae.AAC.2
MHATIAPSKAPSPCPRTRARTELLQTRNDTSGEPTQEVIGRTPPRLTPSSEAGTPLSEPCETRREGAGEFKDTRRHASSPAPTRAPLSAPHTRATSWPFGSLAMNVVLAAAVIFLGMQRVRSESGADSHPLTCDDHDCLANQLGGLNSNGLSLDACRALSGWITALFLALAVGCAICWALAPCWLTLRALAPSTVRASAQAETRYGSTSARARIDVLRTTTPWTAALDDAIRVAFTHAQRLRLLSLLFALVLSCVLVYFVFGARTLGLAEPANPTS